MRWPNPRPLFLSAVVILQLASVKPEALTGIDEEASQVQALRQCLNRGPHAAVPSPRAERSLLCYFYAYAMLLFSLYPPRFAVARPSSRRAQ
jgi:hypothetical protein